MLSSFALQAGTTLGDRSACPVMPAGAAFASLCFQPGTWRTTLCLTCCKSLKQATQPSTKNAALSQARGVLVLCHALPMHHSKARSRLQSNARNPAYDLGAWRASPKSEERPAGPAADPGHAADALPAIYQRVRAKPALWGARFAEPGPDALNGTRFAGLEGNIANGYANALIQVLAYSKYLLKPKMHPQNRSPEHLPWCDDKAIRV